MATQQKRRPNGRPCLPGGQGREPKKHKAETFSAEDKLKVLNFFNKCNSIKKTIKHFYPRLPDTQYQSRRTHVLGWKRNRAQIEKLHCEPNGANKMRAREQGLGTTLPQAIELKLVRWINELREEGVPVTTTMLKLKALNQAEKAHISPFTASWSWQKRQGQIRPPELDQIAADFAAEVKKKAAEIGATRIFNADQTAACFEYLPKRTLAKTGTKTVWVKCAGKDKDRATVMLLGDSKGSKYPPVVVFKVKPSKIEHRREENDAVRHGFSKAVWKNGISQAQHDYKMRVYANEKGWWNGPLTIDWLQFQFGDPDITLGPILLLLDDFSGHWTEEVVAYAKEINVTVLNIPPNATSVCQPADTTWNGPLKARLRNLWIGNLQEQFNERNPDVPFKLQAPKRHVLCFKKCGLLEGPRTIEAGGDRER